MELRALPFTLQAERKALWKQLLAMCFIAALGGSAVYWQFQTVAGWFLLVVGGLLIPVAVIQLLPGASSLTLDQDGFHVTGLYHRTSYRWDEIEEFGIYYPNLKTAAIGFKSPASKKPMVGFNFLPDSRPKSLLMRKSREELGYEAALGDIYGYKAEEFAVMMNAYRVSQTRPRAAR